MRWSLQHLVFQKENSSFESFVWIFPNIFRSHHLSGTGINFISGMDTWGSFSLTLIDSLDTLLIMGNETEFMRAADIVLSTVKVLPFLMTFFPS